jgi:hypothetical protein
MKVLDEFIDNLDIFDEIDSIRHELLSYQITNEFDDEDITYEQFKIKYNQLFDKLKSINDNTFKEIRKIAQGIKA